MREIASPLSGPFTTFGQTPIDIYKVGAYRPELAYSFYNDYYRRGRQPVNLLEAITHTRNGNATMTGDYGPELVTNGSFDSDLTGWSSGASVTATYVDGALQFVGAGALSSSAAYWVSQDINLEENKTYEVSYDAVISSGRSFRVGHGYNQIAKNSQNGSFKHQFTAINNASRWDKLTFSADSGATLTIDNISVREVPKIQWAPHNLLTYSEDFSNAAWTKTATDITPNAAVAPDGTQTADEISHTASSASINLYASGTGGDGISHTFGVYLKYVDHPWFYAYVDSTYVWVNLQTGTIGTDQTDGATLTSAGDGWYYLSVPEAQAGPSYYLQMGLATGDGQTLETVGTSAYIWGAHLYRNDLGGMADVPTSERAIPTATQYVSTTDAARYLPRVNHHAYNGSQWVNKGLLVESEARTNLVTYSNSNWVAMGGGTITTNATTGPDGVTSATLYTPPATTTVCGTRTNAYTTSTGTLSCYIKSNGVDTVSLWHSNGNAGRAVFNLLSGEITSPSNVDNYGIEDIGNGWWRCFIYSATYTTQSVRIYAGDGSSATYNGTDGFYVYGAQHETQATPSSYLPTNGASVTRPAESITIPAANLPWPNPVYVTGEELVTNGTFDTDTDWTKGTGWTIGSGVASFSNPTGTEMYQSMSLSAGVYKVEVDVTASGCSVYFNSPSISQTVSLSDGSNTVYLVHNGSYTRLSFLGVGGSSFSIDNISVKEINPLALSIQMKGEMTYADTDAQEVTFLRWLKDSDNQILHYVVANPGTGEPRVLQESGGVLDFINTASGDYFSPDVNVPFNTAARHGSTFVNLALDGVALTANTTPVALPDLENTDLDLAYDFMGTISLFRIWANDLGDTGIEEATEPSTQATLFLSFDGSNNSYIDFEWSV